ncbi:hypothetical protein [Nocardia sp. NPDC057668]|uniref:hypothetical protein n=1 Tax=Nocardia sp. NPDC057668 TaxID=3346202 RepID=UPI00366BCD11
MSVVKVSDLLAEGSPRSSGLNNAHIERMVAADWPLPPIIVHEPTMRILDGLHRVAAAVCKGIDQLDAHLISGPIDAAFVIAVQANISNGLPLTFAERRAAAAKILVTHPEWSDRTIGSTTGLSAKVISRLRCSTDADTQSNTRLGKDGRFRPVDPSDGRRRVAELLEQMPSASLRTIARAAGVSPGTVRNVRGRMTRYGFPESPTGGAEADVSNGGSGEMQFTTGAVAEKSVDATAVLAVLSRDPALRMSESGRDFLRWLHAHTVRFDDGTMIATAVPDHCVSHVIELARHCSVSWATIAHDLQQRNEAS